MFWKYIFPLILVLIGVVTYFLVPYFAQWVQGLMHGWRGLLILAVVGVALWLYFYFALGFRGNGLKYTTIVILYTAMCLWLLANFDSMTSFLEAHLGVWGMTGVLLIIIIIAGLGLLTLF